MATSTKVGSFTLNSSTGSQSITGLGFQPKLVIFWAQEQIQNGSGKELRRVFGCATSSTARWAQCASMRNNVQNFDQQFVVNRCFKWNDAPTDTVQMAADFTSMDANGFTINVTVGHTCTINYLAIGGSDVNVKVGTFNSSTTNGATQAVTGVGFQPGFVLLLRGANVSDNSVGGQNHRMIGIATSTTARAASGHFVNDSVPPITKAWQVTNKVVAMADQTGSFNATADFSSFDADGFSLAWALSPATTATMGYIALGGTAAYSVFSFSKAFTGTGSQSITGLGSTPSAVMMFSQGRQSTTLAMDDSYEGIGASDGTNQNSIAHYIPTNSTLNTMPVVQQSTANAFMVKSAADDTALRDAATVTSMDASGFTLNWNTASDTLVQVVGFAIKANATTTVPVSGLFGAGAVGSTSVAAKAGVTLTGLAATSALGSVTVSTVTRTLVTVGGVAGTMAVGALTCTGAANVDVPGVQGNCAVGQATVPAPIAQATFLGMHSMIMAPVSGVHVELPKFGVLPNFVPDHPNNAADPSQPTRWTNVLPP